MDSIDVKGIMQPLRKWWWLLIVSAVLAGVSSSLYLMRQPLQYQSRTTLAIGNFIQDPNPTGNEIFLAQQLAATYEGLVQRETVRQATAKSLGLDWLPSYSARAAGQMLEITVVDTDPERAQRVAQELGNQLIQMSPAGQAEQDRQRFVGQRLQKLETDIIATEEEIERLQNALAQELSASRIARLESQIAVLSNKADSLQSTYANLLATTQKGAANTVRVLEPAAIPQRPIDSNNRIYVLVAGVFGFLVAAAAAYLLEYLDDSVRTVEQVEKWSGAPTLAAIPPLREGHNKDDQSAKLIMLQNGLEPSSEAYRVLRTNLQFASIDHPLRTLQVTSPSMGEGKSVTAANLSATLAHSGMRVVLIDADFRRPMQHKLFGVPNNVGVTSALLGDLESAISDMRATVVPNLYVLTSGPLPPNPSELLSSQRMQQLLGVLQSKADILVIDSPPVTVVSDTANIAGRVDGVLLVLKAGSTRKQAVKHAVHALQKVNAHILGVALNGAQRRESGFYYSHAHNYGYASAYYSNAYSRNGDTSSRQSAGDKSSQSTGAGLSSQVISIAAPKKDSIAP
jgi:non-specific protein-tyrosine kinase